MIDLFVFDLGGVLVHDFDIIPEAALRLGLAEGRMRDLAHPDMEDYLSGRIGPGEFWERFRVRSGLRVPENYWATLFRPVLDPDMESLVLSLKSSGRVVCGTNTIDVHYEWLRERGFYSCFDAVYASQLLGVSKPRGEFWLRILEAEGRDPGRAFFTDDMEENVEAAGALGIRSHRFEGIGGLVSALEEAGIPVPVGRARP